MRFESPDENSRHIRGFVFGLHFPYVGNPEGTVGRRGMEKCGLSLTRTLIQHQLKEVVEYTMGSIEPTHDPFNASYRSP